MSGTPSGESLGHRTFEEAILCDPSGHRELKVASQRRRAHVARTVSWNCHCTDFVFALQDRNEFIDTISL
jgi:hypothetical protein